MSVSERMRQDAALLEPGQSVDGSFTFESKVLANLKPGSYRLETVLYGWNLSFSNSELSELGRMGASFLIGECHAVNQLELQDAGVTSPSHTQSAGRDLLAGLVTRWPVRDNYPESPSNLPVPTDKWR
jgi:hypothetical protein